MLSSAEAELHGLVKGSAEAIGIRHLLSDIGIQTEVEVYGDASAALSIVARKGVGRVRHLDIRMLWVQEKAARKEIEYKKVAGTKNPADLMTKSVPQIVVEKYCRDLGMTFESGRADSTPQTAMQVVDVSASPKVEDWWSKRDRNNDGWTRGHAKPRRTMFTPMGAKGGPVNGSAVGQHRITRGSWTSTGERFVIVDNWKKPKWAHRDLGELWIGETAFVKDATIDEEQELKLRRSACAESVYEQ